jgi:hypothetical protein
MKNSSLNQIQKDGSRFLTLNFQFNRWLCWLLTLSACLFVHRSFADAQGDYRSVATGFWTNSATWETNNGTTWVPATFAPTSAAGVGVVTIRTGNVVTNTTSVTMDQIVVQAGGTLASTATLTVANGADAIDLDLFGNFIALGGTSLTIAAGANVVVESGGVMIHNGTSGSFVTVTGTLQFANGGKFQLQRAGGTIPLATWSTGSICEIAYSTASASKPTPQIQTFDQFVWNNPLQSGSVDLAGVLTNFNGNFLLANSGGQEVKWSGDANFGANLTISNGVLNVSGANVARSWTLKGDLNIATNSGLNVSASATGSYILTINGTGIQNYTCTGTNNANKLNWTVNNGSTLNLNNDLPVSAAGRILTANGTVNVNGKNILADLIAGTGTIRNQGGGAGKVVIGINNSTNTLDGTLALLDGASGSLGLVKAGNSGSAGLLTITAPYTYSGGLLISNGVTLVNNTTGSGTGSGGISVLSGTLGGTGAVTGPVIFSAGSLSPGVNGIGTFTNNGVLTLAGNTRMEIDKSNPKTNDLVTGISTVTYAGTLTATNIGGSALAAGDAFKLFNASTYLGSFGTIVPATPDNNIALAWDTSTLNTDGKLRVVSGVVASPILNVVQSGSTLTFNWSDAGFKLQSQTNLLSLGLQTNSANWFDYPGGTVSGVSATINPANPTVFFRLSQ